MDQKQRLRRYRLQQALTLLLCAAVTYYFMWHPSGSAWFSEYGGSIFTTIFQVVMSFFMMIAQFIGLMYFLGGTKVECIMPGDAQSFTLEADYWGQPELKKRALALCRVLVGGTELQAMGGRAPSGLLLSGPPGSGKTFLAKCMAGSAGVPFLLLNGGSVVSMWMGVGVIKIMRLFGRAKKYASRYGACVIVIDEIDSIASSRGNVMGQAGGFAGGMFGGMGMMSKNALLSAIDGLGNPPGIIGWLKKKLYGLAGLVLPESDFVVMVVGSTNRPAVLDAALLRSGRLDITWNVDLPRSDKSVIEIAEYYADQVLKESDVDVPELVRLLNGLSPADLKTVFTRNAPMLAVIDGRDKVSRHDIERAVIERVLGVEDPPEPDEEYVPDKLGTAWHEAGHLIACLALFNSRNELAPAFASIVPFTGTGRLGRILGVVVPRFARVRAKVPMHFYARQVMMSLAGREAERMGTGTLGMGFYGDRRNVQASLLAMVLNGALGLFLSVTLQADPQTGGYNLGRLSKEDRERFEKWIAGFEQGTRDVLETNWVALESMVDLLMDRGTVTVVDLQKFVQAHAIVTPDSVQKLWAAEELLA